MDATELRFALRRYLAARPQAALTLDMIRHAMRHKGLDATDQQIKDELTYWVNLAQPHVTKVKAAHSAIEAWQITSEGRLADERGD